MQQVVGSLCATNLQNDRLQGAAKTSIAYNANAQ